MWYVQFIKDQVERGNKHDKSRVKIWNHIGTHLLPHHIPHTMQSTAPPSKPSPFLFQKGVHASGRLDPRLSRHVPKSIVCIWFLSLCVCLLISDGAVGDPRLRQARGRGGTGVQAQRAGDRESSMQTHTPQGPTHLHKAPSGQSPHASPPSTPLPTACMSSVCLHPFIPLLTLLFSPLLHMPPPLCFGSVRRCSVRWT